MLDVAVGRVGRGVDPIEEKQLALIEIATGLLVGGPALSLVLYIN